MNPEARVAGGGRSKDRTVPAPSRLDPSSSDYSRVLAAHGAALAAGEAGYLDPSTGLFVMTVATLEARGRCCGSGCRHCPWVES
jgi:hypothetical protein